ncbi:hypothetical protein T440DRAFT_542618, partial [Plenodomus tracheiphilus IPT5]
PSFRFLDLHPELRNIIYKIAADSDAAAGRKSSFRALTQTCRQIRDEFRSLYLGIKTFHVTEAEVVLCLEALYPGSTALGSNRSIVIANILICIAAVEEKPSYMRTRTGNLLHVLLRLSGDWPRLTIRFNESTGLMNQYLDIMLKKNQTPPLVLDKALGGIRFICSTGAFSGVIYTEITLRNEYVDEMRRTNADMCCSDTFRCRQQVVDHRVREVICGACFGGLQITPSLSWFRHVPRQDPLCVTWLQSVTMTTGGWRRLDEFWR